MFNVSVSKYKSLLRSLNKKIEENTSKLCIANEYGYCSDITNLKKLNYIKDLLTTNFVRRKISKDYYCKTTTNGITIEKIFNKIVGDKVEIIVNKSTMKIITTDKIEIPFPTFFPSSGIWVGSYFIPVVTNSIIELEKIKDYLNKKKLFSYVDYTIDYGRKIITSCKHEVSEKSTEYIYKNLDEYCNTCLDETKFKRLIEDVCRL